MDTGTLVAAIITIAVIVGLVVLLSQRDNPKRKAERDHFREAYGLSVDRMLAESPVDRDVVRQLRDSGKRDGLIRATAYVKKWDPVPLEVAKEFAERV